MIIKHTFRRLLLPALLLISMGAAAQVSNRIPSAAGRMNPATQGLNPATQRINPANNRIVVPPAQPTIVSPGYPGVVAPGIPVTPYRPRTAPLRPGPIITTPPVVIVPEYPSAWIGPTIIRETYGEPVPTSPAPGATSPVSPAALRLVALVGMLARFDPATGTDQGLGEMPLGVSVGVLTGYGQSNTVSASGDFFGTCWDGPGYFSSGDEDHRSGPFLGHPMMTLNEFHPAPWEFEAGMPDRRIAWMRLAVTLFEDHARNPDGKSVNLPRGRRAAMREVLRRITWTDKGVAAKSAGIPDADANAGGDVTHFGKALATFAEKTMTPVPDNERVGIAEWHFTAREMAAVIAGCPRFSEIPDGRQLRETRAAAGNTSPPWVRACELVGQGNHYACELWFVVVPDVGVQQWLQKR